MNSKMIDFAPREDERSDSQLWAALCAQDDDQSAISGMDRSRLSVVDSEAAFANATRRFVAKGSIAKIEDARGLGALVMED